MLPVVCIWDKSHVWKNAYVTYWWCLISWNTAIKSAHIMLNHVAPIFPTKYFPSSSQPPNLATHILWRTIRAKLIFVLNHVAPIFPTKYFPSSSQPPNLATHILWRTIRAKLIFVLNHVAPIFATKYFLSSFQPPLPTLKLGDPLYCNVWQGQNWYWFMDGIPWNMA